MIAIRNLARTSFTVNLDLADDYEGHPECTPHVVRMVLAAVTDTGEDGVRHYERQCPGALTWQAGEEKMLPDAVARPDAAGVTPSVSAGVAAPLDRLIAC